MGGTIMIIIENSNFTSHHLTQLHKWFEATWGTFENFDESKMGIRLPSPILALDEDRLVGGLSFTAFKNPEKDEMALWINALYIASNKRGIGIGLQLIEAAENVSSGYGYKAIYANTNVPGLYLKNDWVELMENGEDIVLKKDLNI